jgi:hypothetical protein
MKLVVLDGLGMLCGTKMFVDKKSVDNFVGLRILWEGKNFKSCKSGLVL